MVGTHDLQILRYAYEEDPSCLYPNAQNAICLGLVVPLRDAPLLQQRQQVLVACPASTSISD